MALRPRRDRRGRRWNGFNPRVNCECQTQIFAKAAFEREKIFFLHRYSLPFGFVLVRRAKKTISVGCHASCSERRKLTSFQNQLLAKISPLYQIFSVRSLLADLVVVHVPIRSAGTDGKGTDEHRQMFSVHLSVTPVSTGADKAGTCLVIDTTSLFVIDTIAVFFVIRLCLMHT